MMTCLSVQYYPLSSLKCLTQKQEKFYPFNPEMNKTYFELQNTSKHQSYSSLSHTNGDNLSTFHSLVKRLIYFCCFPCRTVKQLLLGSQFVVNPNRMLSILVKVMGCSSFTRPGKLLLIVLHFLC